ncbi:zinc-dependent alcohol dehydrogenase family protein [Novosphingobium mangrovi (ex Huang et al. 2023)]|uniref:NAD(P)-dependent alcohol dehydrogenase n=1 Tax=Novosphingobium mangrovi (ex Huang et al. 2023) TaxID=2976432 RepID=A0ABT2I5D0_9SPHN|nr:NAD(P)-dependent alcohol dehydrogenase [Novosphingobium mangrovi (ex Huang et al. 2023)]MCT2400019.1 NAD(P)-dependent alcohol dehydrogenase [Novosphingobium mangrovi (ex Huang et al. 2023)]
MMKQATVESGKGIDTIAIHNAPIPEPGPGQALIRIKAATLNFRDTIVAKGLIPGLGKEPEVVPLSCCAAEVVKVADGVTRVAVGERVVPIFAPFWMTGNTPDPRMLGGPIDGVARQYAVFDAESLCHLPDELGDLEGATLACAVLTAWSALTAFRPTGAGDWVLAHGTGGVSIAALQLAKAMGANVAITSSSDAKLARAASYGADLCINYRQTPDWAAEVRKALDERPLANVIDTVGAVQFDDNVSLLGEGGQLSAIGMLGSDFSWTRMGEQGVNLAPIGVGNREQHEAMTAFIVEHRIKPVVDVVYDLDRLVDAYRHLESGRFFGKVGVSLL